MYMRKIYAAILTAGAMAAYAIVALAGPNDPIPLSGYVRVQNGGTGAQTLSGLLKGNGTSAVTTATGSDITSSFTGTCDSTTFLRGDGTCDYVRVQNGGTGAQTLSGLLKGNGTSAVTTATGSDIAGSFTGTCDSTTFLRGDGACVANTGASLSGTNTWTGTNTFQNAVTITANGEVLLLKGTAVGFSSLNYIRFRDSANTALGYFGKASTTDSDIYLVNSQTNGNIQFGTAGTGSILGNGVDMTPSTTVNNSVAVSGCTTNPGASVRLDKIGAIVVARIGAVSCTSNSSSFTLGPSAIPAAFQPTTGISVRCGSTDGTDNSVTLTKPIYATVAGSSDTITLGIIGANWTNSGTKAINGFTCVWPTN